MKRMIVSPEVKQKVELDGFIAPGMGDSPAHEAKVKRVEKRSQFLTLAEKIAQSNIYYRNEKIPKAESYYPSDVRCRFVDKYFPYAQGGALYVDEPKTEAEMIKAYDKQKLLKKLGLRSIVIENGSEYKELQTAYSDCLEQLGEL